MAECFLREDLATGESAPDAQAKALLAWARDLADAAAPTSVFATQTIGETGAEVSLQGHLRFVPWRFRQDSLRHMPQTKLYPSLALQPAWLRELQGARNVRCLRPNLLRTDPMRFLAQPH